MSHYVNLHYVTASYSECCASQSIIMFGSRRAKDTEEDVSDVQIECTEA